MTAQQQGPSLMKLGLILYPFTTAAVAVNLYMLSLAWQWIDLPLIPPVFALLASLVLSIPVNWLAAKWVRRLLNEADG